MKTDNMKNEKIKEQGFTLIEVIIAMGILAFGLLAMASMQVMAIQTNGKANRITEAATLSMGVIEQLRVDDISIISDSSNWLSVPNDSLGLYRYQVRNVTEQKGTDDTAYYKTFRVVIKSTDSNNALKKEIEFNGISTSGI
ncbi:prepilin-type N-terminal cleavage/methylation domain-containing protein [Desulfococcaceae bacterium HSG9]|nr:prepilin-type N-terminal cleavage/methylation domain-containing protein [Desulfococcaceae bacterium HSG9]